MKKYIGTKQVKAKQMNRKDYNEFRGWVLPDDVNDEVEGYLIEYDEGYMGWIAKEIFEVSYHSSGNMSFGHAITAMKNGEKVSRAGWNGKGMWVIYNPGSNGETQTMFDGSVYKNHGVDACEILPHFDMYTVKSSGKGAMLAGWLASQSDIAANDWGIVDD